MLAACDIIALLSDVFEGLFVVWKLYDCLSVIVCYFSQRVDETLDVAGEDSSQAVKEADPGYITNKGKPPSKLKLRFTHFYFPLYHL